MTPERRKYVLFGVLATITLIFDQVTKAWARDQIRPLGYAGRQVAGSKLLYRYSENAGVAFGMFQTLPGGQIVLTLVALAAFALVIHYLRKTEAGHVRMHAALGLVGGGAVGNLIDRIVYGRVTDFVVVDLGFWPLNPWPAFNVADAALVIGVGLMALDMARPQPQAAPARGGS